LVSAHSLAYRFLQIAMAMTEHAHLTDLLARRAVERCDTLGAFSEDAACLTRTFLSPPMRDVHAALSSWMTAAGMSVRIDAVGNLIGHYPAQTEAAPALLLGSHLDTVPNAGKYDGALGVLLALATVESLGGRRLPFAVDVIGFSEEEGVRFGVPYLGSLAVTGGLTPELLARPDKDGVSVSEAIRDFGLDPDDVPQARLDPQRLIGYVEVHIEQGPVLEGLGQPLGVVDAIAGQTRTRVAFTGRAGHAGTTPMAGRRDALAGAAELVLMAERLGRSTPGLVVTVGQIEATPGASNVIPGGASLSLDVRHARDHIRVSAEDELKEMSADIALRRGLTCGWMITAEQAAVPMDDCLTDHLAEAVQASGQAVPRLVSGAGHDAAIMARVTPTTMLFLRSPGGLSHHPDESVLVEDVEAALSALSEMLRRLASPGPEGPVYPRRNPAARAEETLAAGFSSAPEGVSL
jgi:allantoate deiminase